MATKKAKAAAAAEETIENEVSTQSVDEGITVQADVEDKEPVETPKEEETNPSTPEQDTVVDDKLNDLIYSVKTLGVTYGYVAPTKQNYKDILVSLDVVDTKTQNAVFKALSV